MSKERELLQEILDQGYFSKNTVMADIFNRIVKQLAQPKPVALSKEQYMRFFADTYNSDCPISDFVKAIEKAHGIGE
jgi:hypothetical protein